MISVARCADIAGLSAGELILGIEPSDRHKWLLAGYLLNKHLGQHAVLKSIVADLRRYLDLGVPARAADLLIVLRLFLSETGYPARQEKCQNELSYFEASCFFTGGLKCLNQWRER